MKSTLLASAFVLLALPAAAQVTSREGIALQNQILELKQDLANLQQLQGQANPGQPALPPPESTEGNPPPAQGAPNDMIAQLVVRVGTLEEEMRALQGRVDELANQEHRDHDELAKQLGDLAFKLGAAPGAPGAPPAGNDASAAGGMQAELAAPTAPPPPPPKKVTSEQALKSGGAALARHDYPAAEAAARDVLAHGTGPLTGEARYLLARALLGEHQYKDAAATFFAVYKASPRTPRGGEGLLGVANSFVGLKDTKNACLAVAKFSAEFPRAEGVLRQTAASVKKRASCK